MPPSITSSPSIGGRGLEVRAVIFADFTLTLSLSREREREIAKGIFESWLRALHSKWLQAQIPLLDLFIFP
jgi:hypothetical protein